jgi:hypothetical protein
MIKWGEPFIACSISSPEGWMCFGVEGHEGPHWCNEWLDGEMTGFDHVWRKYSERSVIL